MVTSNTNSDYILSKLSEWTDEDCLKNFYKFLGRVSISNDFVQDSDGLITHQIVIIRCGPLGFTSEPMELDWPMVPAEIPSETPSEIIN